MRRLLAAVILLCLVPVMNVQAQTGVSDARFARLAKGVNLSNWFWYGPEGQTGIRARFADSEFVALRNMGFTFVRIPINLPYLLDINAPDLLNQANVALLDESIDRIQVTDLAVLVDIHSLSLENSVGADGLAQLDNPKFLQRFLQFWASFAKHMSAFDPERTFLGPINDPVFQAAPEQWATLQETLIETIRQNAPKHTIMATGASGATIDALQNLTPLQDTNIVYEFHFYEPIPFTHQGASWLTEAIGFLRDVPYPSSPSLVETVVNAQDHAEARQVLIAYGSERWDATRLRTTLQPIATWRDKYHVRVICTEFGALRDYAPPADRAKWISDIRSSFDAYGIGWAMWDYDANFGLATRDSVGTVTYDAAIVSALGLQLP